MSAEKEFFILNFRPPIESFSNRIVLGDNLLVMQELLNEGLGNHFSAIYFDGPFNSGRIFSMPHADLDVELINPWIELKNIIHFQDHDSYLEDYRDRILLAKELLNEKGIFILQINQREVHYMKVLLDQVFGKNLFLGEYIWWHDQTNLEVAADQFSLQHETILFYAKSTQYLKLKDRRFSSILCDVGGYTTLEDEDTCYPSQKPEKLMERIIEMSSLEGDLVGDFYCGSGTFAVVAHKLNRKWIASDYNLYAVLTSRERISRICSDVTVHELRDFSGDLSNGTYHKASNTPVCLEEIQNLFTQGNVLHSVIAFEYTPEVDLLRQQHQLQLNYRFPKITSEGIEAFDEMWVERPTPIYKDGEFTLFIQDQELWVLCHILHYEIIREDRDQYYHYNWSAIQSRVHAVIKKVENQWIKSVELKGDLAIGTDVFNRTYAVQIKD